MEKLDIKFRRTEKCLTFSKEKKLKKKAAKDKKVEEDLKIENKKAAEKKEAKAVQDELENGKKEKEPEEQLEDPVVAMKREGLDKLTRRDGVGKAHGPPKPSEYKDKICNG